MANIDTIPFGKFLCRQRLEPLPSPVPIYNSSAGQILALHAYESDRANLCTAQRVTRARVCATSR